MLRAATFGLPDFFQMLNRKDVMRAAHGLLGLDQGVEVQNAELSNRQFDLHAVF